MSLINAELVFQDADLVAEGGERWVYESRDYPDFIFKLQKPVSVRNLKNNLKGNSMRMFPSLADRIVHREYAAYLQACLVPEDDLNTLPVNKLYGFAASNIGLVQVSEKVSLDGNVLGPTLRQLHQGGGLAAEYVDLLNVFAGSLLRWGIPTNDISGRNIVLGKRNGCEMFIAVDGFGDIQVLPVQTYFAGIRRRALAQRLAKVARSIGLTFDPQQFRFL